MLDYAKTRYGNLTGWRKARDRESKRRAELLRCQRQRLVGPPKSLFIISEAKKRRYLKKLRVRKSDEFSGPPVPFKVLYERHKLIFLLLVFKLVEDRRVRARLAQKEWRKRHPDKLRAQRRSAKHRRRGAEGNHTKADIDRLFLFQRGKCVVCRRRLIKFDVDHILPIALGGSNYPENLQLLCPPCNKKKGALHPVEFMQRMGALC